MGSVDVFASLLKLFSALAVVLGLMIGGMYLFRGLMKRAGQGSDDMIRILSTKYLGPKASIMLMDILGQIVVVGVAGGKITMLTTITDSASLDRLRGFHVAGGARPSVADQLAHYRSKFNAMRQLAGKIGQGK
ncbi:MAG: flagellar biosynthetic protein FliO [Syntrophales bacterium]|nr:flagellar biosynthetic protein FliO [Syntrophales bacterium]MDD5231822.1 flagellar biosynthetic protein FliO [Syntrophales bacterium]MDD5531196.1 flagellar biosynthetic protein FliO [Syntrophales bacterium]